MQVAPVPPFVESLLASYQLPSNHFGFDGANAHNQRVADAGGATEKDKNRPRALVVDDAPDHPGRAAGHDPVDRRADDGEADPALLLADATTDDPHPRAQGGGGRDGTEGRHGRDSLRGREEGVTEQRPRSRH